MLVFLESFDFIIGLSAFALVAIFILWKFPLPPELRSGNMWRQAGAYEQYLPGWKGRSIKYFFRLAILAGLGFMFANFLVSLSGHK